MPYDNIAMTVGNTPLVRLNRFAVESAAAIFAKIESRNPMFSVKCRIGLAMIEAGEQQGKITRDTVIIEPTSGNTGLALA